MMKSLRQTCRSLPADLSQPSRRLVAASLQTSRSPPADLSQPSRRLVAASLQTSRRLLIMNIHFMRSWKVCRKAAESMREGRGMRQVCRKAATGQVCRKAAARTKTGLNQLDQ